jgi:glycerol-3-phosphate acyltransferase PlsX
MRIAIDAMGGDHAPSQVVEGVALAVKASDPSVTYVLIGDAERVRPELARVGLAEEKRVELRHSADTIQMHEKISSLKAKPDSSILRAAELMAAKEVDAVVALGNTAAAVAATQLRCRLLEGVRRAGIAVPLPSMEGATVVIDMGANVNAKPEHLLAYAVMASVYCKEVFKKDNPRVGLLNVGEEEGKGNGQLRETYALLEKAPVNFVGNVEGGDLFDGTCDVAVCDGFVGNVTLKAIEGAAGFFGHLIKSELGKTPIRAAGGLLCRSALKAVKDRTDYATYGGAPLLGVNGICIIGHGKSDARAVASALKVAGAAVAGQVNSKIVESLVR